MLKQRIITAVVLLAVLAGALLAASPWPLVLLLTVAAACLLWEWLRLSWPGAGSRAGMVLGVLLAAALCAVARQWLGGAPAAWALALQHASNRWLAPLVSAAWVLGATAMVLRGDVAARGGRACLSVFGLLAVIAVWSALVQMFLAHGAWFLVSLLALIWCADIAAYFAGRAWGRRKLAPKVSPGKTWAGAIAGVAVATAWVMASAWWPGSFGAALLQRMPWWAAVAAAAALAALSIVGDLFESLLKRRAGLKDSSGLLPGHGGVYDRIDALLPVAPIALLLTGGWTL
jgi:phosphatidate cytidylyltransferase